MDLGAAHEGELVSLPNNSSLHETKWDIVRERDSLFKDGLSYAKLVEPPVSVNEAQDNIFLSDQHQEEDVVMGKRKLELGKSSEEEARVKAGAGRASKDEESGGTNKQMAPAKICLRKSGSKKVSL